MIGIEFQDSSGQAGSAIRYELFLEMSMIDLLLAQNHAVGYIVTVLGIGLGLLAVCVPVPRKRYIPFPRKSQQKVKKVRHAAAGTAVQKSKYGIKK